MPKVWRTEILISGIPCGVGVGAASSTVGILWRFLLCWEGDGPNVLGRLN
jgi:hypothetical protein